MTEPNEKQSSALPDLSRRSFLKGAGVTSLGVAIAGGSGLIQPVEAEESASNIVGPSAFAVVLQVNGTSKKVTLEPRTTLAEALRDGLHLTGTKVGCDRAACGACTVILDGKTVPACMTLALDAVGRSVQTIEGLAPEGKLHPLQSAFVEKDALQCGFCTSGMVMSCKHLLDHNPQPTREAVLHAISGNICRCGTYPHVVDAVMKVTGKKGE